MGQKVSPVGLHIGVIRGWKSRWYADKDYADLLLEDIEIREFLFAKCKNASVSRAEIERSKNRVEIMIRTACPGVIIETNGENAEILRKKIEKLTSGKDVCLKVLEIANSDLDAKLVARSIVDQLEQRASFRTAQRKAIRRTMHAGVKDIKIAVSSRLGGAGMTRTEGYSEGVVPLHTLRADVDYTWEEASTTYGRLSVKVWIYHGEVLPRQMVQEPEVPKNSMDNRRRNHRGNRDGNRSNNQRNSDNRNSAGGSAPRKAEGGK